MKSLFEEYYVVMNEFEANSQEAHLNEEGSDDPYGFNQFFQTTESSKTKLNIYLDEALESGQEDLDVLSWWKLNLGRFPILPNMTRDLLAIPISIVASESTFSTGGIVIDPHRSSLTP
ncbi:hypothetical protein JHK84_045138 [Glycine max]|uniref:Putative AC9 transposase n=1 Tax=Glycine soja TaxID=3848 RepID=A0A0B2NVD3_GLYSO|nr:hypothetical protein JHK86_045078 [Glycine max]KAG4951782.1 hypothetical protein JHK85_045649 [Glycine max]KAG5108231.1 hypothetical protein JHK84_045138 [Glycine max]KHM99441.1 Putative AC9 transposase [Glycine soja]